MNLVLLLAGIPATVAGSAVPGQGTVGVPVSKEGRRPNVIYIMTDQHWAGAMSCAGNTDLHTPAMDALASHGIRFTNAYCSFPLSGPSRAAMFTGLMPSESGVVENEVPLPASLSGNTLGQMVRDAGYDCAYAGKWHVNTISLPGDEAFGFRNIKDNGDRGVAEACVEYMKQHSRSEKPYFLVASFVNPHNICEYARGQKTPHADIVPSALEDCPGLPSNFAVQPYDASVLSFERGLNYSLYPTVSYSPDDWRRYRDAYYRLVEAVDAEIGKIVAEIERQKLWEDTVIIFTSDHGDGCGAHQWNQKTALYEEVANVPLIVCVPGKGDDGKVSDALVNEGVDLMPSLCCWTGAVMPEGRSGRSLRPVVEAVSRGVDVPERPYIVTETNFIQTSGTLGWMVRTPKYKYVLYDKGNYREQLYDMENDRGETRNLAVESRYGEILRQHREMLREWLLTHPASLAPEGLARQATDRDRHLRLIP
ncbi:MAG: sulfatase [Candidatus Cryptobacteroides sp.]